MNQTRNRSRNPLRTSRAILNILVGLAITGFAFVGFFYEDLELVSRVPKGLVYFYCVVALLYGPFRIWRGVSELRQK